MTRLFLAVALFTGPLGAEPEPLTLEQKAEFFRLAFELRDAQAAAMSLQQQLIEASKKADAAAEDLSQFQSSLDSQGCQLTREAEWECPDEAPAGDSDPGRKPE